MIRIQHGWQRATAWVLVIIAIVFWLWFGIGSAYVEGLGPMNWLLHILVPGGVFALTALLAWRWEGVGGAILVLEGVLALGFTLRAFFLGGFTTSTLVLMCLTLAFPPLAAGILFLLDWRRRDFGSI